MACFLVLCFRSDAHPAPFLPPFVGLGLVCAATDQQYYQQKYQDCNGLDRTALDVKKAVNLVLIGVYGLYWTALELYLVVIGGLEPPTPAL